MRIRELYFEPVLKNVGGGGGGGGGGISDADGFSYEVGLDRRGLCGVKRRGFGVR